MRHFKIEMKAEEESGKQQMATTAAQQLNWKKSCEKKIEQWKKKTRGKLTVTAFPMQQAARGW